MSGYVPTPDEARLVEEFLSSELFVPAHPLDGVLAEPFAHKQVWTDMWDEAQQRPCFDERSSGRCRDDVGGEGCHHPKVTPEHHDLAVAFGAAFAVLVAVAVAVSLIRMAVGR